MTKFGLLGAAGVILSSALASPAMAQQVVYNPGYCSQFYPNANCQNTGPGNPYTGSYQRRAAYRHDRTWNNDWNSNAGWNNSWNDNRWDGRYNSGFGPADVAAGVVGGAIGTAGAIATAPFRGNSFASYDNGYRRQSYAERNGLVCTPGTWFKGKDGRRHLCQ
jgi:hypothetical protein